MTATPQNELLSPLSFEHIPYLVSPTGVVPDSFSSLPTNTNRSHSRTSIDLIRNMASSIPTDHQNDNLTVLDVYDEAAIIGKEFERVIEGYGAETIRDLVPKVIHILELLESQAVKNEKEADILNEMKTRIERLEMEKHETRELRDRFNRELELTEEQWRKEADNLMALVSKLEDENRQLREELQQKSGFSEKSTFASSTDTISITREELECIKNLTDENLKLKRMLKAKERELTQKSLDIEGIQGQLERVCKLNCTLRQKNTLSTNQTQRLMVEKFDLEVQLKEKENFINHMKDRVADELTSPTSPTNPISDLTTMEANQPRFSYEELRQVLWERNDLKTKLMEVEVELRLYKEQEEEDNGAVEGPIPLEPDEKLYGHKRDESKIRQFFRALFPLPKPSPTSSRKPIRIKRVPTSATQITSSLTVSRSYSTFTTSVQRNRSSSQRPLVADFFHEVQQKSRSNTTSLFTV